MWSPFLSIPMRSQPQPEVDSLSVFCSAKFSPRSVLFQSFPAWPSQATMTLLCLETCTSVQSTSLPPAQGFQVSPVSWVIQMSCSSASESLAVVTTIVLPSIATALHAVEPFVAGALSSQVSPRSSVIQTPPAPRSTAAMTSPRWLMATSVQKRLPMGSSSIFAFSKVSPVCLLFWFKESQTPLLASTAAILWPSWSTTTERHWNTEPGCSHAIRYQSRPWFAVW
mmetsp:Transcript_22694/g.70267  ORF Transcript_22694/g.70267 Transcript_22694/m.70267 type:complete len:225 (+) Transcript_22694:1010-1684(+)